MIKQQSRPVVGQTMKVRGVDAKIVAVHRFGTVDVVTPSGRYFRISGLVW